MKNDDMHASARSGFATLASAASWGLAGYIVGDAAYAGQIGEWLCVAIGAVAGGILALLLARRALGSRAGRVVSPLCGVAGLGLGWVYGGIGGAVAGFALGVVLGWIARWLGESRYRAGLPAYATSLQVLRHNAFLLVCGAVFFFLIAPILVIIPLSFNAEDFFTFTPGMLALEGEAYSLKHYRDFFGNPDWQQALRNSIQIAPTATILSVSLGTLAAIGLSQSHVPFRRAIMAVLISPMIVPLIISAAGMYFFYSRIGLQGTYVGVVLAHAALGIPFVIITVTATLVGFDKSLTRAAANAGAGPVTVFFRVQMPLILPGVISGGLFAFITSFDEVVVVIFVGSAGQKTLPWQMFTGLREQISPTILAVATILVALSIMLLTTIELLRRRSERLRGMSPG